MTLGVVIPVFRAGDNLGGVVDALRGFARDGDIQIRVVLVEDAGGDADAVREIVRRQTGVTGVLLEKNVGQQMATYLGLAHVLDCDFVATMDDDGQHPVSLLGEMLEKLQAGADLCYAAASRAGIPLFRRVGAALRDLLFSLCTNKPRGIRVSAYRVMTVALARKLAPEPDGYIYLSAAAFKHKPRTECVDYRARLAKTSSYTVRKLIRLYGGLLVHYTPVRVFFPAKRRAESRMTVLPGRGYL